MSTAFPLVHWVILGALASSIALCFLIEVDQSEGRFFSEKPEDSIRLRVIFSIMIGVFSGLSALCLDLNDLFRGSFNVVSSGEQFKSAVRVIEAEVSQVRSAIMCAPD